MKRTLEQMRFFLFKTTIYNLPGSETLNLCLRIAEVVLFSTMRGLEDS